MKKFSKEVKIGLAFIVALVVLYYGINFLRGVNIFKPANTFTVIFEDVDGLNLSAPVTLNGFQVGVVSSMKLCDENPNDILVSLAMNKGIEITKGSKITIDVSMLGGATLVLDKNNETTDLLTADDRIRGVKKRGLLDTADDLTPKLETIIPRIDSILIAVHQLVGSSALRQSIENIDAITTDMTRTTKEINILMSNLNKNLPVITENFKKISSDLSETTANFKEIKFASTIASVDSTMKNIEMLTGKLNEKNSSLGLLLNDRQLYDSLNATVGNASALLKDVKEQPERYINIKVF